MRQNVVVAADNLDDVTLSDTDRVSLRLMSPDGRRARQRTLRDLKLLETSTAFDARRTSLRPAVCGRAAVARSDASVRLTAELEGHITEGWMKTGRLAVLPLSYWVLQMQRAGAVGA